MRERHTGINWLKNIVILLLAALCVYQTGRLWFDEMPGINDFLNLLGIERAPEGYGAALDGLARPRRIFASEGDRLFVCNYSRIEETEQYRTGRLNIMAALNPNEDNRILLYDEIDWDDYLITLINGEALIFDYGFNLRADAFNAAFGSNSDVLSVFIDYVNMIVFVPVYNGTKVVFLGMVSEAKAAFEVYLTGVEQVIYKGLPNRHNLVYIAQIPADERLGSLAFMPQSLPGGVSYAQIRQRDPHNIREFLPHFFENPDFARSEPHPAGHKFVTPDEIISLTMGFYLNYQNWLSRRSTDSFAAAYATAILFMQRDTELVNDYYLEFYEYDSGTYIFHFNYIFNDFPVFLSASLKNALDDMQACIEVTVEKGRVSRYRRYVVRLEELRITDRHEISAETALRDFQRYFLWNHDLWNENNELSVDFMDLAYYLDTTGTVTGLSFNIFYNGEFIPVPILN